MTKTRAALETFSMLCSPLSYTYFLPPPSSFLSDDYEHHPRKKEKTSTTTSPWGERGKVRRNSYVEKHDDAKCWGGSSLHNCLFYSLPATVCVHCIKALVKRALLLVLVCKKRQPNMKRAPLRGIIFPLSKRS